MISAAEFRKLQTESQAKKQTEKKDRFIKACDKYTEAILEEVQASLEHVRSKGLRYNYIMLEHKDLIQETDGFAYTTLLYGFWNKDTQKFDDSVFGEHGVTKPFDRAAEELRAHGYKLENVSDPARSKRLYIKLSWDEPADA